MKFSTLPTDAEISSLAHQIWIDEGKPDGRAEIHWQWALEKLQNASAPAAAASDVSLIDGIGPKIAKALIAEGFDHLQKIAALTLDQLSALDEKLKLKGRGQREDWIAQAKELIAGKAPRAKADQAKAASRH